MRYLLFVLIALSLFTFTACNQTDEFENLDLLLDNDWNLISIIQDGVEISDSCDLDDVWSFTNSSEFVYEQGTITCPDSLDIVKSAKSWKIIDDFTTLRMRFSIRGQGVSGSLIEYWEIIELTDSTLVIEDALAEENDQIPEVWYFRE